MNPTSLKSLVDQHASAPNAAALGMAPPGEGGYEDEEEDPDAPEPMEPAARGAELVAGWGEWGKELEDSASDLHDLAHDAGAELLLKEPTKDAIKAVEKSVDRMPDDLSMGIAKYVSALSPEDVTALATYLCSKIGEDKADCNLLTAYLKAAASYAKEEIEVDEDFNVPEEDEEEDEDTDEEKPDDAPPGPPAGEGPPAA